jgi:hypothetical protein
MPPPAAEALKTCMHGAGRPASKGVHERDTPEKGKDVASGGPSKATRQATLDLPHPETEFWLLGFKGVVAPSAPRLV